MLASDETAIRVAISLLERADLLARTFDVPQEIAITVARRLPASAKDDRMLSRLLKGLALGSEQSAAFSTVDIARFMRWPLHATETHLLDWQSAGYLTVKCSRRAMSIELASPPADYRDRLERLLAHTTVLAQRRIDDVIGYATTDSCRHGYISAHFGSPPRTHCDVCDNCTGIRPPIQVPEKLMHLIPDDADIEPMIIDCLVSLPRAVGRSGLARILAGALRAPVGPDKARHHGALKALGEATIVTYVDDLLEENRLRQYERQGYLVLAPTLRGRAEAEAWLIEHPDLAALAEPQPVGEDADEAGQSPQGEKYTDLQKALWLWRRRMAEELSQPPYVVMSNDLMLRIAETRPQTMDELAALPGMGVQRLQYYGAAILDFVKLNPPYAEDADRLAAQRQSLTDASESARETAAQMRSAAHQVTPQTEKQIYLRLQEMRQKRAIAERTKSFQIASDSLLKEIARRAPLSLHDLDQITGFRTSGFAGEANQILTMIAALRVT